MGVVVVVVAIVVVVVVIVEGDVLSVDLLKLFAASVLEVMCIRCIWLSFDQDVCWISFGCDVLVFDVFLVCYVMNFESCLVRLFAAAFLEVLSWFLFRLNLNQDVCWICFEGGVMVLDIFHLVK